MTGRDLIMYILANGLENEPVFTDGKPFGFMTKEEAAVYYKVGVATIEAWIELGTIPSITVGNVLFIPRYIGSTTLRKEQ